MRNFSSPYRKFLRSLFCSLLRCNLLWGDLNTDERWKMLWDERNPWEEKTLKGAIEISFNKFYLSLVGTLVGSSQPHFALNLMVFISDGTPHYSRENISQKASFFSFSEALTEKVCSARDFMMNCCRHLNSHTNLKVAYTSMAFEDLFRAHANIAYSKSLQNFHSKVPSVVFPCCCEPSPLTDR